MNTQDQFESAYESALIYAMWLAHDGDMSDDNYLSWCVDTGIEENIMPYEDDVDAVMQSYDGSEDEVWDQLHDDLMDSLKNELNG